MGNARGWDERTQNCQENVVITRRKGLRPSLFLESPMVWPKPMVMHSPHGDVHWAPGSGGLGTVLLGSTALKQSERPFLEGYQPQGMAQTAIKTHPQLFLWKRPIDLSGSLSWVQTLGLPHREATAELSEGVCGSRLPSLHSPLTSLQLTGSFQKEAYTFIRSPDILQPSPREHLQITRSGGQQGSPRWSQRTVYICIL